MKNIDRIKEMDLKELTKFLNESTCNYCSYKNKDCGSEMCGVGVKEWLNQESELTYEDISYEFNKFCNETTCGICNYPNDDTCHYEFAIDHFNIIDGKITRRQK